MLMPTCQREVTSHNKQVPYILIVVSNHHSRELLNHPHVCVRVLHHFLQMSRCFGKVTDMLQHPRWSERRPGFHANSLYQNGHCFTVQKSSLNLDTRSAGRTVIASLELEVKEGARGRRNPFFLAQHSPRGESEKTKTTEKIVWEEK